MNPDSRLKWVDKCASTGKPILGPYVKDVNGKTWLKNQFRCQLSGQLLTDKYVAKNGLPYLKDALEDAEAE